MADTMLKPAVMIVDDTPANLEVLEEILYTRGYKVNAFPRGEMALRAAAADPPDLILLDIMMPDMDGFEVCRRLKSEQKLADIPVIFISALDDTANKVKAFSHGGVDYVSKPFQEEEVRARVETHVRLRRSKLELEDNNKHLEELVWEKVKEISESQMATLAAISNLSEFRDDETGRHIQRTQVMCRLLALKMREIPQYEKVLTDEFVETLYHAATLHDIGKIGIPDGILLKPGKLDPEEFEVMKTHSLIGATTLKRLRDLYPNNAVINIGVDVARSHHEKWNGRGYPDGLTGTDIPLAARIMAVVDVYDALRSKRPYKDGFTHEKSLEILQGDSGQHFDPDVIAAFIQISDEFRVIVEEAHDEKAEVIDLAKYRNYRPKCDL